jgi:hypothetical protein
MNPLRLQDENKLLRARLQVAVDALEGLLPFSEPCPQRERARAVVKGERELMNPTPRVPRHHPGETSR